MWHQLLLVSGLSLSLLGASRTHVVERGDTLYQLSRHYDVSVSEIVRANPSLSGGQPLHPGQKLQIPSPNGANDPAPKLAARPAPDSDSSTYIVHKGDTLSSIGNRYHITPAQLRDWNGLSSNHLQIGQRLTVRGIASPQAALSGSSPIRTGGRSSSRPPESKPRYLYLNRIMAKLDAPHVVPGRWKYVVIHHSGTPSGNAKIFDYFHRNIRGMENGLAYHFVIGNGHDSGDGEIEVGSRWTKQLQGGHLASEALNEIAIGICFVGDFNSERPTKRQIAAAIELITYLNQRCGKPLIFKAHREINPKPTECPGRNFPVRTFHQLFD